MSGLFDDDCGAEVQIKTDNEYAKNYNTWRKKEELNRLKTKYGDDVELSDESSSSSDDEDGVELTEQLEKDFFKTLACLKSKDPRIYDKNATFFTDEIVGTSVKVTKVKDQPMFLKDYERKLILEKGGVLSDEENEIERPKSPTYVEEQNQIKDSLKKALDEVDDNDNEWGGLFKQRTKTKEDKDKEETDYIQWLAGQKKELKDKKEEKQLKPLKDYWNKPNLDEGEKFLRDYILNKRFLDHDNDEYVPTYEEIVHGTDELSNDEETIEKQEEFEHKYNFRFEEPDQEFIKRYPRTMENSLRKKDDRRKVKRQELKERKKKEKEEKMQDLKKLQELKRKEIEEKLEKLKEITGNPSIGFGDDDLDGDFDPEEHDRKMQALFNDEFYQGPEGDQKPQFPDLDEELEIENWEKYQGASNENAEYEPHCEDEDFNMDCEYDPSANTQEELIESTKSKKKRKRKSKFAEAMSRPKPKFDPNDKNYEEYFEEYYKLDCEDIIGDLPCRFKYRQVAPNDFGLTIEEIILAKERELNKWCSLKKAVQIRPDHVEKYDQIAYKKKAQNINLKKKILPSLFGEGDEETDSQNKGGQNTGKNITKNAEFNKIENCPEKKVEDKNVKKSKKKQQISEELPKTTTDDKREDTLSKIAENSAAVENGETVQKKKKKVKNGNKKVQCAEGNVNLKTDDNNTAIEIDCKKHKRKKNNKKLDADVGSTNAQSVHSSKEANPKKMKKRKRKGVVSSEVPSKKSKRADETENPVAKISDARLAAFGINPKKFKNKLKYKK
ncbi:unnamed protein product [Acanthoscelides obtectus]|uniref:Protein KRI1 homolog n=1 Tax=Acanthoscelides obtectus TaxID=200917 RepID=A0A9P0KQD8_ACAOB|nr:unnamed protein product [Acanthoscelides obtectus]CAK1626167.1 Protein KRI1 homolog [Acanthoscelides obtectus]